MNKEIQSIIRNLQNVLDGEPWFGRSVYPILDEIDESKVNIKPNDNSHSLLELLYHMNTWTAFTLKSLEKAGRDEITAIEEMDWRNIDTAIHSWEKGLAEFRSLNETIIQLLNDKDDSLLKETVDFRKFNYRFMLNGLIQHHIYHLGQIAYVNKLLRNHEE
ncbi:MAG: DinB family protein [Bacteroidota bacterium]